MSTFDSLPVQEALKAIDQAGRHLPKSQRIELCEEVASYFDESAQAARDELRAEEERER